MKKILFVIAFITAFSLRAQQTISGTFSPADEYTWLIVYRINPAALNYIADTAIKNGEFTLNMPAGAEPGMYRLVYAVPQEEFYFDVIYTGKEGIRLSFDAPSGVTFVSSEENKVFSSYFEEMNRAKQAIISFYSQGKTDGKAFLKLGEEQLRVQKAYEERSKGLKAHEFIKANNPYIASSYESIQDYMANTKAAYFNSFDFKNPELQASDFLSDKAANYVFTALPLEPMTPLETEVAMQANVSTLAEHLQGVSEHYQVQLYYKLWSQAAAGGYNDLADFIYTDYLRALAAMTNNQKIIDEIEVHGRLRLGAIAPEIIWKEAGQHKSLSALTGAEKYVLVFWSSTCGHCLNELPALHKKLKENPKVKVLAVGLEDDDVNWKVESAKLETFEHAIALGKWDSDHAHLYAINQTPTYFILDTEKRIIAKPESDKGVIEFLEKN